MRRPPFYGGSGPWEVSPKKINPSLPLPLRWESCGSSAVQRLSRGLHVAAEVGSTTCYTGTVSGAASRPGAIENHCKGVIKNLPTPNTEIADFEKCVFVIKSLSCRLRSLTTEFEGCLLPMRPPISGPGLRRYRVLGFESTLAGQPVPTLPLFQLPSRLACGPYRVVPVTVRCVRFRRAKCSNALQTTTRRRWLHISRSFRTMLSITRKK